MSRTLNAQQHEADIFEVMQYVASRCSKEYDSEMENRFLELIESFSRYRSDEQQARGSSSSPLFAPIKSGHNSLVAQHSALLVFANTVSRLAEREDAPAIKESVDTLWKRLEEIYQLFFGCHPDQRRR